MEQEPTGSPQITIGSAKEQEAECLQCHKKGKANEFFSYEGKNNTDAYLCTECRKKVNAELESKTKNPHLLGALALGGAASIVGGVIWYFLTILIQREFGYVAIGLGYLVGMGVHFGSGRKYGRTLQVIALLLTLVTIFVAKYFIFNYFVSEYIQSNLGEFPDFQLGDVVMVPIFSADFLKELVSPIGLLIYAIGAYVAYRVPQMKKV